MPSVPSAVSSCGRHFDMAATRTAYPRAPTCLDNRGNEFIIKMGFTFAQSKNNFFLNLKQWLYFMLSTIIFLLFSNSYSTKILSVYKLYFLNNFNSITDFGLKNMSLLF